MIENLNNLVLKPHQSQSLSDEQVFELLSCETMEVDTNGERGNENIRSYD